MRIITFVVLLVFHYYICGINAAVVTKVTACTTCNIDNINYVDNNTYVALMGKDILQSTNQGKDWLHKLDSVEEMYTWESNPKSMIFLTKNRTLFTTTDGGSTFTNRGQSIFQIGTLMHYVVLHPNQAGWFLYSSCETTDTCLLYYSKDYGATNTEIKNVNLKNFKPTWASTSDIFGVSTSNSFGYISNFATWQNLVPSCSDYFVNDNYIFVLSGDTTKTLYASSVRRDESHTKQEWYLSSLFPFGKMTATSRYKFLESNARSEFFGYVPSPDLSSGSVFSSDFDGAHFGLVLDNVAITNNVFEFADYNGLPGIYIANTHETPTSTNKQTKMTFDNGGDWKLIPAPLNDFNNQPTNCDINKGCSLHLTGLTKYADSLYSPFYANPSTIGLIIAIGNIGTKLTNDISKMQTYFSRDAGLTWKVLHHDPTAYNIGDQGGLIVFASINQATNLIWFSLDQGKTFDSVEFTSNPIYVTNIYTNNNAKSRSFIVSGFTYDSAPVLTFHIDFNDLNLNICDGSGYEMWEPNNEDNQNTICFLGEVRGYFRRNQEQICFNDPEMDKLYFTSPCDCQWEDYECDIGFTPSPRNETDGFTCTFTGTPSFCTSGYRLIPDDECLTGYGINLLANCSLSPSPSPSSSPSSSPSPNPTTAPTPAEKGKHSNMGAIAVVIIFGLIVVVSSIVIFLKRDRIREFLNSRSGRGEEKTTKYSLLDNKEDNHFNNDNDNDGFDL